MKTNKTIFAQIIEFLPLKEFSKCVKRYNGHYKVQTFSCLDQFLSMSFAQLTLCDGLRGIEACLKAHKKKLYHCGIRGRISRSTLSYANNTRDWRIYSDFAKVLIIKAKRLYAKESFGIELENTVYALDSTTIDLCLSLFNWAKYCKTQAGVRVHTLLDLRGSIPTFVEITTARVHDMNVFDSLIPEAGAFYVMDRGYLSFERLHVFEEASAFFIIRSKKRIRYRRLYSKEADKTKGIRSDQVVVVVERKSRNKYPDRIRKIEYYDQERKKRLSFITNNFKLEAKVICELYKQRWKIELFFKWIKQHLRIKKFFGISKNAVKTQIWIAISVYTLMAIIKKELKIKEQMYIILQVLNVSIFEKRALSRLVEEEKSALLKDQVHNQLELFEL